MDIWRVPSTGRQPERMTHHHSRVAYPTFLDERTLIYTATGKTVPGPDSTPWTSSAASRTE